MYMWSDKWLLDFSVQKCAVLRLHPTNYHSTEGLRAYRLKDIVIPKESSLKDFGVWPTILEAFLLAQ
nr:unnamed protein product [Spirometra erinaceieuropaei]